MTKAGPNAQFDGQGVAFDALDVPVETWFRSPGENKTARPHMKMIGPRATYLLEQNGFTLAERPDNALGREIERRCTVCNTAANTDEGWNGHLMKHPEGGTPVVIEYVYVDVYERVEMRVGAGDDPPDESRDAAPSDEEADAADEGEPSEGVGWPTQGRAT